MSIKTAEVVTIGDEILIGQITDTNTQFIATELNKLGVKVLRKQTIGDSKAAIVNMLKDSLANADLVITTGGLGPTKDDITKHTINEFFGSELVLHQPTLDTVTAFFAKRGKEVSEANRLQAMVPQCCEVILNEHGTAPCMWFEHNGKFLVCMPGVPFEMKNLMTGGVQSKIKQHLDIQEIYHKTILTVGVGESVLAEMISDWEDSLPEYIKLAYLPSFGSVKLRLSAYGSNYEYLKYETDALFVAIAPVIEKYIISETTEKLEVALGDLLNAHHLSLATAESCTGGALSAAIVSVAGSSQYFKGSVVAYQNEIKKNILGVHEDTLLRFGAVSEQCVIEMAAGAVKVLQSDLAVAISGIAGPTGGSEEKPVGTIWMACSDGQHTLTKKIVGINIREVNISYATTQSMYLVFEFVKMYAFKEC
jgi:nicotinamide-nucleotide amidase